MQSDDESPTHHGAPSFPYTNVRPQNPSIALRPDPSQVPFVPQRPSKPFAL
jgi:hypothetical protein